MLEETYFETLKELVDNNKIKYSDYDILMAVFHKRDKSEEAKTKAREIIANLVDNNIIDHVTYRALYDEILSGRRNQPKVEEVEIGPGRSQADQNKPLRGKGFGVFFGLFLGIIGIILGVILGDSEFKKGLWIGFIITFILDIISLILTFTLIY